ncbi:MAG: hypothetical protein WKI04_15720 [Ferruginibacter sp.]
MKHLFLQRYWKKQEDKGDYANNVAEFTSGATEVLEMLYENTNSMTVQLDQLVGTEVLEK